MEGDEYVTNKLNQAFFKKLQEFGGDRGKRENEVTKTRTPEPPSRSKSVKERRRSSVITIDEASHMKTTKPQRRNSSIQDERSIHDAYHTVLNEYKRVSQIFFWKSVKIFI